MVLELVRKEVETLSDHYFDSRGSDLKIEIRVTSPMPSLPKILDEKVLWRNGSFERVVRYLSGHHPHLGRLHFGWSGPETIQELDVIRPVDIVLIEDS